VAIVQSVFKNGPGITFSDAEALQLIASGKAEGITSALFGAGYFTDAIVFADANRDRSRAPNGSRNGVRCWKPDASIRVASWRDRGSANRPCGGDNLAAECSCCADV
jgi:hypothetical protein